ncbi:hypothetical protein EYF80_041939 [Liparis tanakae]|uniref:Uncharacterized protein n=1 Tax=Liparis tanakae TaxID=230148 RepID=A0A4Z2G454_9TELE|nr:hypothetical protein EYF80_041939 [Liparis tanakae]
MSTQIARDLPVGQAAAKSTTPRPCEDDAGLARTQSWVFLTQRTGVEDCISHTYAYVGQIDQRTTPGSL